LKVRKAVPNKKEQPFFVCIPVTLALLVRFVEIVCVRSDGFEHRNTYNDDSEVGQIDGCNIMYSAVWQNSCGC